MSERLSRGGLAIGVVMTDGLTTPTVADEEISEADKIKQADAHYQRFPNGPQRWQVCLQFTPPDKC